MTAQAQLGQPASTQAQADQKTRAKVDLYRKKAARAQKLGQPDLADQWRHAAFAVENLLHARQTVREVSQWATSQIRKDKAERGEPLNEMAEVDETGRAAKRARKALRAAKAAKADNKAEEPPYAGKYARIKAARAAKASKCDGDDVDKAKALPMIECKTGDPSSKLDTDIADDFDTLAIIQKYPTGNVDVPADTIKAREPLSESAIQSARGKPALWKLARADGVAKGARCHGFIRSTKPEEVTLSEAKNLLLDRLHGVVISPPVKAAAVKRKPADKELDHDQLGEKKATNDKAAGKKNAPLRRQVKEAEDKATLWKIARTEGVKVGERCHGYIKSTKADDVSLQAAKAMLRAKVFGDKDATDGRQGQKDVIASAKDVDTVAPASLIKVVAPEPIVCEKPICRPLPVPMPVLIPSSSLTTKIQDARGKRALWKIAHDIWGKDDDKCKDFIDAARKKEVTVPQAKEMMIGKIA